MESAHCQLLSWHYCTFSHFTDKQILWKLKTMFSQILDNELIIKRVIVPSQVLLKILPKKKKKWFGIRRKFLKLLGNWKMDKAMLKLRFIITENWLKKHYPPEILWQIFFFFFFFEKCNLCYCHMSCYFTYIQNLCYLENEWFVVNCACFNYSDSFLWKGLWLLILAD